MTFVCPVCGYPYLEDEPWHGYSASDDICPSCGIQFGYDDVKEACGREGTKDELQERWRKEWVDKGMPWKIKGIKPPENWDPKKQLEQMGINVNDYFKK